MPGGGEQREEHRRQSREEKSPFEQPGDAEKNRDDRNPEDARTREPSAGQQRREQDKALRGHVPFVLDGAQQVKAGTAVKRDGEEADPPIAQPSGDEKVNARQTQRGEQGVKHGHLAPEQVRKDAESR